MPTRHHSMLGRQVLPTAAIVIASSGLLVADGVGAGGPAPAFDPLLSEPARRRCSRR